MKDEELNDFINACAKLFCLECGRPVSYSGKGRPRVFCSDRCRWAYDKRRRRQRLKEEKLNENSRIESDPGEGSETGRI
jgi:endogenous inhibitor of DNA gyrase (YacG/DUF329 family)